MFALPGWGIEQGSSLSAIPEGQSEELRWQDAASALSIWEVRNQERTWCRLRLNDEMIVDVLPAARLLVRSRPQLPQITIDHFLADQVFPRIVAMQGSFVVHAGAVRIAGSAVILIGDSGRGKSTLTSSFDKADYALLGDDAMILSSLDKWPLVRAVYPSLRLFPDSIEALMPGAATAGSVAHYSSKQRIDIAINHDVPEKPIPLKVIFALGGAATDGRITVRPLTVADACMVLVESSFALDPSDTMQARRRLYDASAVARVVPAFELSYPRDYARLPEVRQAILDQVAALVAA